ncbi:Pentatricopeptide repeat-containing protein [Drosera capensis]
MGLVGKECRRMVRDGEVEGVVEVMEVLAGSEFPIKKLVKSNDVIAKCIDKRIPDIAVRYASLFPHAHVLVCSTIKEFGRRRDLISALTAFEASEQKIGNNKMLVYRTIIDACGLCGDYFRSRSIYEDLLAREVIPNIYVFNSLMNANAHDVSYNIDIYKKMKNLGVIPDMASYNILLKSCCLAGRVDLAQDIYKEVKRRESKGALKLDLFTYSTIIKIFADAKLWQMALGIKEDMVSAGVTPNTVTWSSLINACAKTGHVDQAAHLFEEMLLAGCEPNTRCLNTLLNAFVEASQYDRAFRVFETWKDCGSQKFTEGVEHKAEDSVASTPSKSTESRQFSFAKVMPFSPTTVTYNILLKACGSDYFRAMALFKEMKSSGLSPNQVSWSSLINICGAAGDVTRVLELLKGMRTGGSIPDVVAYTNAIQVCVECKHLKTAFRLFAEMKKNRIRPNLVTYNTLLRARDRYGSLDQVQQCLAIYLEMRKAGFNSNDYYLKQLIGEWCEGLLQKNNNHKMGQYKLHGRVDSYGKENLLLERVAMHLQKSTKESILIDIRGLTKVEARIVVLAVLRMFKENHSSGLPIKDDLLITLGKEVGPLTRHAITNLLSYQLGLEVIVVESSIEPNGSTESETQPHHEAISKPTPERSNLPVKWDNTSMRPVFVQRLLVTKESLYQWLQKKPGAATSYR